VFAALGGKGLLLKGMALDTIRLQQGRLPLVRSKSAAAKCAKQNKQGYQPASSSQAGKKVLPVTAN
jgi:hypothetical protein